MKTKLARIFLLVLLALSVINCNKNKPNKIDNLEFTLTTDKEKYFEGEPVWVNVKVRNIGNNTEKLEFWYDLINRSLELENPGGKITDNKYGVFVERLDTYRYLKPDSELTLDLEIQSNFGDGTGKTPGFENRYFIKGEHKVRFMNKSIYDADPIEFTVNEAPEEEKRVYDEFCSICAMAKNKSSEEMLDIHYNFAVNHKNSRYFELAVYSMLVNQSSFKMNMEQLNFCMWYIDNYYNSNYVKYAISEVIRVSYNLKGGKQGALDFLNGVIQKHPNTRASQIALEHLNDPVIQESYLK
jgi:hypothetical protein